MAAKTVTGKNSAERGTRSAIERYTANRYKWLPIYSLDLVAQVASTHFGFRIADCASRGNI
jgi:hypothetical protein